jgi:PAS domain S-box-containing protein
MDTPNKYNLAEFSLHDMTVCSSMLRTLSDGATGMDDAANRLVRYLYQYLIDGDTGKPACALVRLFTTRAYRDLPADRQACAQNMLGAERATPDMKCLTLFATAGEQPEWNHTDLSQRYKAIPLVSDEFVAQFPMFSQLFIQLGINVDATLRSRSELLIDEDEHTFNVFYVADAVGSLFVPVQHDFVIPYGVRSVLGFGGLLPSGNLFVVILFTKVCLSRSTADLFKPLTLSAKLALLPFDDLSIVQHPSDAAHDGPVRSKHRDSHVSILEQLLAVHEEAVIAYASQRKRAEDALQDSEARLRAIVHSTKDVILFLDSRGIIRSWNEAAQAQFGYSAKEVHGQPIDIIIEAEYRAAFEHAVHVAQRESSLQASGTTCESLGRRKDGTAFPLELSLMTWKSRTNLTLLATIRDISERKRIGAALAKSESHLRGLIEHAPDTIFTLSTDGVIASLNPVFETMTHWPRLEWVGKPFGMLVHPDDVTTAREIIDYILHKRCPITCVFRIRSRDRGDRMGEFVGTPLIEEGQVVGLLGILRDISERKTIEQALRQSEEQLRSVVQSTQDAIVSLDRQGTVVFWNYGAEQMFGYAAEDMLNQPATCIIPERLREQHRQGIRRAGVADHVTGHRFESIGLKKNGAEFPIEFSLAAWKIDSGLFFTGIIRDITERKWAEEAIGALVRGTASVTGEEFFPIFVRHLAGALGVSYAFVIEVRFSDPARLSIMASWEDGRPGMSMEFNATNTPCVFVRQEEAPYYTDRAQELFPKDLYVSERGVTSFLGVPMVGSSGQIIGYVSVMDARPLQNVSHAKHIITIFAARAAAELERLRATVALRQSEARQALILNSLPIVFYTVNASGDFATTWVSENLEQITGFAPRTFIERPEFWVTRLHPEDRERVLADVKRGREVGAVSMEYRWQTADGSYRWYLDNAVYTRDADGNPKELIGAWIDITRRKQAEEALREGEERFKAFMDHNPAVIFMKDKEGRHVYVNGEFERVLQVDMEEWLGRTDDELWPHHTAEQFRKNDHQVFASNTTLDTVEETVSRTGERQYWRVIKFPMNDVAGKQYLGGIAVDVTGRKRTEEALRQAEKQYRNIFEHAVEGIFQTTREGRYLTVNPALAHIYGYQSSEEMMSTVTDIGRQIYVDPRRREEFTRLVEEQGAIMGFESQITRKDGRAIWISESARVLRDAGGRLVGYEGAAIDITARKQAEEALRESQERLALCIQGSDVGIWDWDMRRAVVYFSPRWKQMLGYDDEEIQNRFEEWESRIHPDDRGAAMMMLRSYMEGRHAPFHLEHRLRHKDGTYRWILSHGACLRDQDGTPFRMAGSHLDITGQKQIEQELQSALTRLRTLSGRLEVIREEERGRIARELHDEFGVGLTCLKIDLSRLTALIGTTVGLEKGRQIAEKIRSMGEFIDTTIGGVQRIVSELRPAILDDLGLVAAIEWQAQDFQRRTGIACTLHVNAEHFDIDSERATVVFRICQEALTNVTRHANATTVVIRLEERPEAITLEVTDNGRGIPQEKLVDPQSLGLLGMRERADLFGGFVTIAGRPDAGTAVTLHLRCSQASPVVEGS